MIKELLNKERVINMKIRECFPESGWADFYMDNTNDYWHSDGLILVWNDSTPFIDVEDADYKAEIVRSTVTEDYTLFVLDDDHTGLTYQIFENCKGVIDNG